MLVHLDSPITLTPPYSQTHTATPSPSSSIILTCIALYASWVLVSLDSSFTLLSSCSLKLSHPHAPSLHSPFNLYHFISLHGSRFIETHPSPLFHPIHSKLSQPHPPPPYPSHYFSLYRFASLPIGPPPSDRLSIDPFLQRIDRHTRRAMHTL